MQTSVIAVAACFLVSAAWAQKPDEQGSKNSSSKAPAVETHTYKGTLVDASCAQSTTQAPASNTQDKTKSASADRAQTCPVSASTKEFALQTTDGKVLRFDNVGNERTQEALKNKNKWNSAASSGKTISAKVTGAVDGDHLTVVAID